MPQSPCYRPVHIKPVTGHLDVRSNPDEVPFGGYRWVLNAEVTQKYKLCRLPGWVRLGDKEDYNNEDLHDQNVAAGRDDADSYPRQPVSFLYQADTPTGSSKLFAGTQNRLYAKSNANGNWRIISDALGGPAVAGCNEVVRWSAGFVGQTGVISNGRDSIVSHVIDQYDEDDGQAVSLIEDLVNLDIVKAEIVYAWNDFIFLFNVVQDGTRITDRIIWSDYQRPLSFTPDPGVSLAGYQDLGAGEAILGVAPLKDSLMIYTTRGIWQMQATGGENVFSFTKRYSAASEGTRCLAYPNTLVSDGESNYYFGRDGIYAYSFYTTSPDRVDWIHRASSIIFESIDRERCNAHVGGYDSNRKSIWWSWVMEGEACPSQSLLVNIEFPFVSYVDHGFTAFLNHTPRVNMSLRDFIFDKGICTEEELLANPDGYWNREGGLCTPPDDTLTPVGFFPLSGGSLGGQLNLSTFTLSFGGLSGSIAFYQGHPYLKHPSLDQWHRFRTVAMEGHILGDIDQTPIAIDFTDIPANSGTGPFLSLGGGTMTGGINLSDFTLMFGSGDFVIYQGDPYFRHPTINQWHRLITVAIEGSVLLDVDQAGVALTLSAGVTASVGPFLALAGGVMNGLINMQTFKLLFGSGSFAASQGHAYLKSGSSYYRLRLVLVDGALLLDLVQTPTAL